MNLSDFISSLIPNLASEGIGILTTVLIVERLLSWREKRRWSCVRHVFLIQADSAIVKIIQAWNEWIYLLGKDALPSDFIEADNRFPGPNVFEDRLDNFAQHALICEQRFSPFLPAGVLTINELMFGFSHYVTRRLPFLKRSAWTELHKEMEVPVQDLSDLVERYSMLVDPKFAYPVIHISQELDNLKAGRYEKLMRLYKEGNPLADPSSPANESAREATAALIDSAIRKTLELKCYVRRRLGNDALEGPFERVTRIVKSTPAFEAWERQLGLVRKRRAQPRPRAAQSARAIQTQISPAKTKSRGQSVLPGAGLALPPPVETKSDVASL